MKSDFKAKFLQHLIAKKQDKGFTLIELLVVIIIIGILSAIALPSFLNQANKAKESESKQYVGSMNRSQQAYFLEKNTFQTDVGLLGLGIRTSTTNYTYAMQSPSNTGIANVSFPANTNTLRAHTGGTAVGTTTAKTGGEATTLAVLCQSQKPQTGNSSGVALGDGSTGPSCTGTFEDLGK